MTVFVLCSVGRVIVERYYFDVIILLNESGVMLEAEVDVFPKLEIRLFPSKTPDYLAICTIDLVN